jgi:hypothetical protein
MSREERRNYQRMMKNVDRAPALPPAARARAERNAARRSARATSSPPGAFTTGYWIRTVLIALAVGFAVFSFQWPQMPFAAYAGTAALIGALAILIGIRLLQRRLSSRA